MSFTLDEVVPWGRSLAEYTRMFDLSPDDLELRILGCGDGPASFNAELTGLGGRVTSADPLYRFDGDQIERRVEDVFDMMIDQTKTNAAEFAWGPVVRDVEHLAEMRRTAMNRFLLDYPQGRSHGRYIDAELPTLPFEDEAFDLALCSHFLFLYSEHQDLRFHLDSIRELCRVATDVRIFPLLELGSRPSRHLDDVIEAIEGHHGIDADLLPVDYEFQRGGNTMLRLRGRSA